jgi:hypothetical protein
MADGAQRNVEHLGEHDGARVVRRDVLPQVPYSPQERLVVPSRGGEVGEIVRESDRSIPVGLADPDPSAQRRGDLHVE